MPICFGLACSTKRSVRPIRSLYTGCRLLIVSRADYRASDSNGALSQHTPWVICYRKNKRGRQIMLPNLKRYWRGFVLWRQQEKLKKQRERLDEEVRRRKVEAAKLGITDMLIDIYKHGHGYQPWISNYESGPNRETTS